MLAHALPDFHATWLPGSARCTGWRKPGLLGLSSRRGSETKVQAEREGFFRFPGGFSRERSKPSEDGPLGEGDERRERN